MSLKFEHKTKPLASRRVFFNRILWFVFFGLAFIFISLSIGAWGYAHYAGLNAIDAYYNASMILTGMGPVAALNNNAAKVFATIYSIYSGVAFLTSVGIMFAPLTHRLFHFLHLELDKNNHD